MLRRFSFLISSGLLVTLTLLAGCGQSATGSTPSVQGTATQGVVKSGSSVPSTPAQATVSAGPSTPAQATASARPSLPITPMPSPAATSHAQPATKGAVTLQVSALSYPAGAPLVVTLSNQSSLPIVFPDHLTRCGVVLLQHQGNGSWETIDLCRSMIVTREHSLNAGQSLTVQLAAPNGQWAPGLYRFTLSYGAAAAQATIFSAEFQVG